MHEVVNKCMKIRIKFDVKSSVSALSQNHCVESGSQLVTVVSKIIGNTPFYRPLCRLEAQTRHDGDSTDEDENGAYNGLAGRE